MTNSANEPPGLRPWSLWMWRKSPWLLLASVVALTPLIVIVGAWMGIVEVMREVASEWREYRHYQRKGK